MWDSDGDRRAGCSSLAASSLVSNVEFGKVERTLSKKLTLALSSYIKAKVNPDMCIDLAVRMETSTCVADAVNCGNIKLAGTNPT